MTINEMMERVIAAYPDREIIRACWNPKTKRVRLRATDDTLALFIVSEIDNTFDPNDTDEQQLATARHQLWNAMRDLTYTRSRLI